MSSIPNAPRHALLLKISSVLWMVWGLVHILAGVMTLAQDTPKKIAGIIEALQPTDGKSVIGEAPKGRAWVPESPFRRNYVAAGSAACGVDPASLSAGCRQSVCAFRFLTK